VAESTPQRIEFGDEIRPVKSNGFAAQVVTCIQSEKGAYDTERQAISADEDLNRKRKQVRSSCNTMEPPTNWYPILSAF
jgi:hypothetical protein